MVGRDRALPGALDTDIQPGGRSGAKDIGGGRRCAAGGCYRLGTRYGTVTPHTLLPLISFRFYLSTLIILSYLNADQYQLAVFGTIMDLYTWKTIGKIRISCQDLHQQHGTENEQVYCKKDTITSNKPIGGYAFSTGPSYEEGTIIVCPPFFAPGRVCLLAIKTHLDDHAA